MKQESTHVRVYPTRVWNEGIAWLSITATMLEKLNFYDLIDGYNKLKAVEWLREIRELSSKT